MNSMSSTSVNYYFRLSNKYRGTKVKSTVMYGNILFIVETIAGIGFDTGKLNKLPVVNVPIKERTISAIRMISVALSGLVG